MLEWLYRSKMDSPLGQLELVSTATGLVALHMGKEDRRKLEGRVRRFFPGVEIRDGESAHRAFRMQIREYFEGRRTLFELPLDLRGTEFQRLVWAEVARIPFGSTATYGEIAHLTGRPRASRAVGAANGANPIPIIVPCHRVIGADGSLTGYGGGMARKRWLLAHEGVLQAQPIQMGLFRARSGQAAIGGPASGPRNLH